MKPALAGAAILLAGIVLGAGLRPLFTGVPPAEGGGSRIEASAGGPRPGPPTPAITTAIVQSSTVDKTVDAIGASRAARSVTLIAEATGLVTHVNIAPGTRVDKGEVLLQIEDAEQRAALARLRAQYPIAKSNSGRYAALYKDGAASRLESEAAFNEFKAVEAELAAAEFALSQRKIRAPFSGIVGLTDIEPGDYIRVGDIATTIDDLSSIIIEFTVPQESAADVRLGQPVFASLASGGGARATGAVSAIDTRVDPASRTLKIESTFANSEGALLPGATYAVTTTTKGAPALALPGLAVQWDRTGAYVWKLATDGAVERTALRILQRRDETAIAVGGLAPGDVVVVEGADRVRPGMKFPSAARNASSEEPAAG
jgi:RND family efflux transporter MFP subunit